ncbi:hypothetical protein CWW57_RS15475 [Vibrio parahaemolyticus]|uniref:hypothetical protein n=2 Tax=Vibrio parahaemolyticus TaxID=670 RepID=UPI000B77B411|nr:hypothetical protein [Vibrio parahaemolyticus]EGQ8137206.1 hypothetical protein [Vibrio parahaemolyticus]EGQ8266517.1 hypothetical protein [Vibrio parahaemolyticus]EGQ8271813.1 hypothetical protein [Vibrio parahaemolyticus]EGQ8320190.1 hypothetical protein [Vibrio parahaemolyticus]EGQ8345205.1 hypothetical protein [Vibrio parahaemolyticus]
MNMKKKSYKVQAIKGLTENGIFNKSEWLKEAKKLMYSSSILNDNAQKLKHELNALTEKVNFSGARSGCQSHRVSELIDQVDATSKSSLLLLSYSVEVLIKAALVCLHQHTARQDFNRLLKSKYRHNLSESAQLLSMPLTESERKVLDRMKVMMLDEARYPVTPTGPQSYFRKVNNINKDVWSKTRYSEWCQIADKIQEYVNKIDSDSSNPSTLARYTFGDDGYCVFRFGGNLPPYLIVNFTDEQVENGENNKESLLELIRNHAPDSIAKRHMLKIESSLVYIDLGSMGPYQL